MSPARWDWTQTGKVEPKRKRETVIGVGDSDTIPWYVVPSPSWYDEQETDVDIMSLKEGFGVSGSSKYSIMSSSMFSRTSFSVLPCVAISRSGQTAINHLPSLLVTIGSETGIVFLLSINFIHPKLILKLS